jgi:SNF2 family DNA or RNA helicase
MSRPTTTKKKPCARSGTRWTPHQYQKRAVKFLLNHYSAALLLDPGLGKTSVTCAAAKVLKKEGVWLGGLVVAPLRPATSTWPDEVEKWEDFQDLDLVVLHEDYKDKEGRKRKFSDLCREQHDIYVINYEGLSKLFTRRRVGKVWKYELTEDGKELMKHVNALIWDELSKMKNSNTLRYTLVKPWLKKFMIKWGLTGSPAANGFLDLFGQCYVLDEGRTLGPFVTHYRHQYFLPTDDQGYNWRLKVGGEEEIIKRLKPLALRMDADDYLKLPKVMPHVLKFDLPKSVRQQYEEMENDLITRIDKNLVAASNAASASSKCRQIATGAIYLDELDPLTGARKTSKADRKWQGLHEEKLDLLADLIEELQGQQLLVAYDFNHDLERLLKRFPKTPYIGGGVSIKRGKELEDLWNKGAIPVLFGHPASIGHGLNLQASSAHHICWFTMTWDFELYDQFNRRLRRQGNKADYLHTYHMMARDTVEESVYYALRRKFKDQKMLLDALKDKRRASDAELLPA